MTVDELRQALEGVDGNLRVFVPSRLDEWDFMPAESARAVSMEVQNDLDAEAEDENVFRIDDE
jgi:hypothetical protein